MVCCKDIVYGKMGMMYYIGKGLFVGLFILFEVMCYYSFVVDCDMLLECLEIMVEFDDGYIMGL